MIRLELAASILASVLIATAACAETSASAIAAFAAEHELSETHARDEINAVFNAIVAELRAGSSVRIRSFGRFELQQVKGRIRTDARTREKVELPSKQVPVFIASPILIRRINREEAPDEEDSPQTSVAVPTPEDSLEADICTEEQCAGDEN